MTALGSVPAKRDGIGDNRRGSQSEGYVMELVEGVVDYGAPEFVSNGASNAEWISEHQIRITYYVPRKDALVVTHHVIYDVAVLIKMHEMWGAFLPHFMSERGKCKPPRAAGAGATH